MAFNGFEGGHFENSSVWMYQKGSHLPFEAQGCAVLAHWGYTGDTNHFARIYHVPVIFSFAVLIYCLSVYSVVCYQLYRYGKDYLQSKRGCGENEEGSRQKFKGNIESLETLPPGTPRNSPNVLADHSTTAQHEGTLPDRQLSTGHEPIDGGDTAHVPMHRQPSEAIGNVQYSTQLEERQQSTSTVSGNAPPPRYTIPTDNIAQPAAYVVDRTVALEIRQFYRGEYLSQVSTVSTYSCVTLRGNQVLLLFTAVTGSMLLALQTFRFMFVKPEEGPGKGWDLSAWIISALGNSFLIITGFVNTTPPRTGKAFVRDYNIAHASHLNLNWQATMAAKIHLMGVGFFILFQLVAMLIRLVEAAVKDKGRDMTLSTAELSVMFGVCMTFLIGFIVVGKLDSRYKANRPVCPGDKVVYRHSKDARDHTIQKQRPRATCKACGDQKLVSEPIDRANNNDQQAVVWKGQCMAKMELYIRPAPRCLDNKDFLCAMKDCRRPIFDENTGEWDYGYWHCPDCLKNVCRLCVETQWRSGTRCRDCGQDGVPTKFLKKQESDFSSPKLYFVWKFFFEILLVTAVATCALISEVTPVAKCYGSSRPHSCKGVNDADHGCKSGFSPLLNGVSWGAGVGSMLLVMMALAFFLNRKQKQREHLEKELDKPYIPDQVNACRAQLSNVRKRIQEDQKKRSNQGAGVRNDDEGEDNTTNNFPLLTSLASDTAMKEELRRIAEDAIFAYNQLGGDRRDITGTISSQQQAEPSSTSSPTSRHQRGEDDCPPHGESEAFRQASVEAEGEHQESHCP